MKNKIIVAIASLALNLVLFAVLTRATNLDNLFSPTPPAFVKIQHLPPAMVYPN